MCILHIRGNYTLEIYPRLLSYTSVYSLMNSTIYMTICRGHSIHENVHVSTNYVCTLHKPVLSTMVIALSAICNDTSHLRNLTNWEQSMTYIRISNALCYVKVLSSTTDPRDDVIVALRNDKGIKINGPEFKAR